LQKIFSEVALEHTLHLPVRESLEASTHYTWSFFSKTEELSAGLGLHRPLSETVLMLKRLDQTTAMSFKLLFAKGDVGVKESQTWNAAEA
jgi:hypothetical protein